MHKLALRLSALHLQTMLGGLIVSIAITWTLSHTQTVSSPFTGGGDSLCVTERPSNTYLLRSACD